MCPTATDPTTFCGFIYQFSGLINAILALLAAVALAVFFIGLVRFMFKAGDVKEHASGRNLIMWGLAALFVLVSIAGIINFFAKDIFGTTPNSSTSANVTGTQQCSYDSTSNTYSCPGITNTGNCTYNDQTGAYDCTGEGATGASNCSYDPGTGQYTCPGFAPDANGNGGFTSGPGVQTANCVYQKSTGSYFCSGFTTSPNGGFSAGPPLWAAGCVPKSDPFYTTLYYCTGYYDTNSQLVSQAIIAITCTYNSSAGKYACFGINPPTLGGGFTSGPGIQANNCTQNSDGTFSCDGFFNSNGISLGGGITLTDCVYHEDTGHYTCSGFTPSPNGGFHFQGTVPPK